MNVRVAVVQATPAVLDGPASVRKACRLIGEAAAGGARLIALPEGFVPIMPRSCWGHHFALIASPKSAALHRRIWENAVDVGGPLARELGDAARRADAWVAIGVNERDARRPGTLWNTLLWFAPDGSLARRHRKLVPTMHERTFWGQGAGDDLEALAADFGRLGGLICWENFMPAARRRLHRDGVDFYLAPTADDRDIWVAAMRTFAFEAGAFVLSPVQYLRTADFPEDFPLREELADCPEVQFTGGSVICDPWGNLLAGPVHGGEEILYADCDLDLVLEARRVLDTAGHYDRPDLASA
uniref:Nitrilase n=1 Tax=uncultured organism TaxID=155900 RepID=Q6RWQ5_9ZZZZ|nr:nitrilase [uncultured organism]